MQENEALLQRTRSELIKQARESCAKNMNGNRSKGSGYDSGKRSVKLHKESIVEKRYLNKVESTSLLDSKAIAAKIFMIRIVIAIVLFLGVVLVDQLHLTYNHVNSNSIQEAIQSNKMANQAVDVVTAFTKEKIIDVFNGLH